MTTAGKIRVLFVLLCASLLLTAIIVQNTYSPASSLNQTAHTLEDNLHKKERDVNDLISDKASFNQLKTIDSNANVALKLIKEFTTEKSIWFVTYNKNRLGFWSGVKIIPEHPESIREGSSFIEGANAFYDVIKKSEGDFSVVFFIPVKINYAFQNQYLQNTFAVDLLKENNIDLAHIGDKNVYTVHSINNTKLFDIKLKREDTGGNFYYYELSIWLITLICLCGLINSVANYIALKGYVLWSVLFLAVVIGGIRFLNLVYRWPGVAHRLKIFNPDIYASSFVFRSLGDLCINILLICWLVIFVYTHRNRLVKKTPGKIAGYIVFVVGILVLIAVSTSLQALFLGLVINSKINFDLNNFLNLSYLSFVGVLMLCFTFLIFYLLSEVFLTISNKLNIPNSHKTTLFVTAIVLTTALVSFYNGFTFFYLLWAVLIFVRAYAYQYDNARLDSTSFAVIILICTIISALKLNNFESVKEKETRTSFIQKLEVPNDSSSEFVFKKIEKKIIGDTLIFSNFNDSIPDINFVKTRLQKLYFNGDLSKYDVKVYEYDDHDRPLIANQDFDLGVFKDMVVYSAFKVPGSAYFYRPNEVFGFQRYFAILPVIQDNKDAGTLVIYLQSKPLQQSASFGLLIDAENKDKLEDEFKGYSYAFYSDGRLITQNGNYLYDIVNTDLQGKVGKYLQKTTGSSSKEWYSRFITYSHLIYMPSKRNLIVVSKEEDGLFYAVTSVTFFFVIFLLFGALVVLIRWLWLRIKVFTIKNNRIGWKFKINFDLILYKTRIQFSMIFAVVVTLVVVGFITFFSISTQYEKQQDKTIKDKITKIAAAYEKAPINKYLKGSKEKTQVDFDEFANAFSADLTLFDLDGNELINTQPKIYEYGLQARRMNARAFVNLSRLQRSQYVNDEVIGKLSYKAVYVPLQQSNTTYAYLQLPYFSNESDYKERIGSLLNIMINVYALVFIAIGLFAVIIARQITSPLSFIQQSLSNTIYGQKNEPIKWERNDEIGALVKEYNKMISALENSAQKLAQSERESAWREMAKQVAHEIKNPLTPLKLGLQLLDKSWKDKDPKFDQKFERFSKSFVEQIESLSSIASEFSAFAKMPDTRIERINIFEILGQVVIIFKEMDNIKILYQAPENAFYINADRDQLLRCFNNLLKNAIEATPAERQGVIDINYLVTSKNILLTIKDNGQGIPENLREKIFEPNFTTKSSGTGLGLAFVKNSIENAGGKVWFETQLGEGTTFYFSIPAA